MSAHDYVFVMLCYTPKRGALSEWGFYDLAVLSCSRNADWIEEQCAEKNRLEQQRYSGVHYSTTRMLREKWQNTTNPSHVLRADLFAALTARTIRRWANMG